MRAYELMVIFDGDLEEAAFQAASAGVVAQLQAAGAQVPTTEVWGRRRFAYEIDHKHEGYYSVYEILALPGSLDGVERSLRLADEVVRHKMIHLPDDEAARRGLLGEGGAAAAAD